MCLYYTINPTISGNVYPCRLIKLLAKAALRPEPIPNTLSGLGGRCLESFPKRHILLLLLLAGSVEEFDHSGRHKPDRFHFLRCRPVRTGSGSQAIQLQIRLLLGLIPVSSGG